MEHTIFRVGFIVCREYKSNRKENKKLIFTELKVVAVQQYIRESVDSLCRDETDAPIA